MDEPGSHTRLKVTKVIQLLSVVKPEQMSASPGWLSQQSVTVQVERREGIKGSRYHGNAVDAVVPVLNKTKQLHHTET